MVKFNLQSKLTHATLIVLVIVVIVMGINAYGTTTPSTLGHTFGELNPPTGCASNQVIQWTGSSWTCITLNFGDITGVNTASGSGLVGGASSGEVNLALANPLKTCPAGQVMNNFNLGVSTNLGCVTPGGYTLNPTVYSALYPATTSMGSHFFCFLTQISNSGPSVNHAECTLTKDAVTGIWTLHAGGETGAVCGARCVD